jgi:hypothetical protein
VEKKGERNNNKEKKGENKINGGKLTIFTHAY